MRTHRISSGVRLIAAIGAMILLNASLSIAHDETDTYSSTFKPNAELLHRWGSGSQAFPDNPGDDVKEQIVSARTAANEPNGARAPSIAYSGSGSGRVLWAVDDSSECGPNSIACARYYGTDDDSVWYIWVKPEGQLLGNGNRVRWCVLDATPCHFVRRAVLHEFGHILGLDHYDKADQLPATTRENRSIMYGEIPFEGDPGENTGQFQVCDEAGLQWNYGRATSSTGFSGCLDHIDSLSGDGQIRTTISDSVDDGYVCPPLGTTLSGKLKVWEAPSNDYGGLANQALAGRDVLVRYRTWGSTGSFTTYATVVTNSQGNWSKGIAFPSPNNREWKAVFQEEGFVNESASDGVHVVFGNC